MKEDVRMKCDDCARMPAMQKTAIAGLTSITLPRGSYQEIFLTATPVAGETSPALFRRAAAALPQDARILSVEVLGIGDETGSNRQALEAALGGNEWPVTWLTDCGTPDQAGVHVWAAVGVDPQVLKLDWRVLGVFYEDEYARYCRLGGVTPLALSASREDQAREVFRTLDQLLDSVGMEFSNVIRTWFYNHHILDWYAGFNRVRDAFFREKDLFGRLVPASTGIGGANPAGAALQAGLLALQRKSEAVRAFAVPSPLQCPALDYGRSFSRAAEFDMPDHRRLFVSGTASIEPGGKTAHVDDMDAQVRLTMQVVEAILESRGMTWADLAHVLVYVRNAEDAGAFQRFCEAERMAALPAIVSNNVVCRDDLLFEVEGIAIARP
jgi:enamine deaminase RidA (YjgF/YER057c/UK114 family)